MIHAEFMGLPGSGKSTIRYQLIRNTVDESMILSEHAIYEILKNNCFDNFLKYILNHIPGFIAKKYISPMFGLSRDVFPGLCSFLIENSGVFDLTIRRPEFKNLSLEHKKATINRLFRTASYFQTIDDYYKKNSLVIFDENFLQKSAAIFVLDPIYEYEFKQEDIERYLELIPLPDILIHIECDIDICFQRMKTRSSGLTRRYRNFSDKEIYTYIKRNAEYFQLVVECLISKNVNIMKVNSSNSILSNVNYLLNKIKSES